MDTIKNKVDVTQSKLLSSPIMTKVPLFRNFCKFTKKKKNLVWLLLHAWKSHVYIISLLDVSSPSFSSSLTQTTKLVPGI